MAGRYPFHEESRSVTLADDFNRWEEDIRNIWTDLADADAPFNFCIRASCAAT